jgi:hypothetical protein
MWDGRSLYRLLETISLASIVRNGPEYRQLDASVIAETASGWRLRFAPTIGSRRTGISRSAPAFRLAPCVFASDGVNNPPFHHFVSRHAPMVENRVINSRVLGIVWYHSRTSSCARCQPVVRAADLYLFGRRPSCHRARAALFFMGPQRLGVLAAAWHWRDPWRPGPTSYKAGNRHWAGAEESELSGPTAGDQGRLHIIMRRRIRRWGHGGFIQNAWVSQTANNLGAAVPAVPPAVVTTPNLEVRLRHLGRRA